MGTMRLFLEKKSAVVKLMFHSDLLKGDSILIVVEEDIKNLPLETQQILNSQTSVIPGVNSVHQVTEDGSVLLECPQTDPDTPQASLHLLTRCPSNTALSGTLETHTCAVCGQHLEDQSSLNIHYRTHAVEGNLHCGLCNIPFTKLALFKEHLRTHGTATMAEAESQGFQAECDICHKKFQTVKGLGTHRRAHRERHLVEGEGGDVTDVHVVVQRMEADTPTVKNLLEMESRRQEGPLKRLKSSGSGTEQFSCSKCTVSFNMRTKLEAHLLKVHHQELPHKCAVCGKVHVTEEELRKHILERHTVHYSWYEMLLNVEDSASSVLGDGYKCNYCEHFASLDPVELSLHLRQEHEDNLTAFVCPHCAKRFTSEKRYSNHIAAKGSECCKRPCCKICFKVFSAARALRDHMIAHHGSGSDNKSVRCDLCDEAYATKSALRYHIKAKHGSQLFNCGYCEKTFALEVQRQRHEDRVHRRQMRFQCSMCHMSFATKRELLSHILCGHKVVPNVNERGQAILPDGSIGPTMKYYQCEYCEMTTYSRKAFIRHQVDHTGIWPFTCEVCGKGFAERFQAEKHVRLQHSTEETYSCHLCSRLFVDLSTFNDHINSHNQDSGQLCSLCTKYYDTSTAFEVHMSTCHSLKDHFPCDVCSKNLPSQAAQNLHKLQHKHRTALPLQCDACNRKFKYKGTLWAHKYKHCKASSDTALKSCEYCGVSLKNASLFEAHLRRHMGLKPYSCSFCGKGFTLAQSRQLHVTRFHTNDFEHYCPKCGKGMTSGKQLRRHLKAVHNTTANSTFPSISLGPVNSAHCSSTHAPYPPVSQGSGDQSMFLGGGPSSLIGSSALLDLDGVEPMQVESIANVVEVLPNID